MPDIKAPPHDPSAEIPEDAPKFPGPALTEHQWGIVFGAVQQLRQRSEKNHPKLAPPIRATEEELYAFLVKAFGPP